MGLSAFIASHFQAYQVVNCSSHQVHLYGRMFFCAHNLKQYNHAYHFFFDISTSIQPLQFIFSMTWLISAHQVHPLLHTFPETLSSQFATMTIKFSLYKMNEFYFSSGRKLNLFETCTFLPENKKLTINLLLILIP